VVIGGAGAGEVVIGCAGGVTVVVGGSPAGPPPAIIGVDAGTSADFAASVSGFCGVDLQDKISSEIRASFRVISFVPLFF